MDQPAPLYLPRPNGIPDDLAAPSREYRVRVLVVLISLLVFLVVYLALLAGTAYVAWWALTSTYKDRGFLTLLLSGAIFFLFGLLFVFLLKGLLRRIPIDEATSLEITEAEQPVLFEFLRQLCAETAAPFPARVLLTAEVNAAVCYHRSLFGLVWPARKNLLLGLGLVNVLNLAEFKAVLAHEFGHFSQKSMKLGSYVYVANQVLADLVQGRDWFDRLLDRAEHPVFRVTLLVSVLRGLVWCVRQLLGGLFQALNFWHSELSQQMEFNADLVAVSVTGSDAIVYALARLNFAEEALDQALHDLQGASVHGLYSRDLFFHQTRVGQPPPLPEDVSRNTEVFQPDDDLVPAMWATHPPNPERERNAKNRYYRGQADERSAWVLFRAPEKLRERVTRIWYLAHRFVPTGTELVAPEVVQRHLDEERAETTFDPRWEGLYDDRWLEPGPMTTLLVLTTAETWEAERIRPALTRLQGTKIKSLVEGYRSRLEDQDRLAAVVRGERRPRNGLIDFRGRHHPVTALETLLQQLDTELAEDRRRLAAHDRQVFQIHAQLATHLGGAVVQDLLARYEFQLNLQEILKGLAEEQARLEEINQFLRENTRLDEHEYEHVLGQFQQAHEALRRHLTAAEGLLVPELPKVEAHTPLRSLLLRRPLVPEPDYELSPSWLDQFHAQVNEVHDHGRRIHVKSLSGILALQERIRREWEEMSSI